LRRRAALCRSLLAAVAALGLAAPATAQLDLPKERPAPPVAPADTSPEAQQLIEGARRVEEANARALRRRTPRAASQLDLPSADPRAPGAGGPPTEVEGAAPPAPVNPVVAPLDAAAGAQAASSAAVAAWLDELAALQRTNDRAGREFEARFGAAKDDATAAARIALETQQGAGLVFAARRLAASPDAEDHARLRRRLERSFAGQIGAQILRTVVPKAPQVLPSAFLVGLLDHHQAPMRIAAERELLAEPKLEYLPHLVRALSVARSDARLRAVEVLGRIDDPAAANALLTMLSDSAGVVAARAAARLGDHPDPSLDVRLLERAFVGRTLFREQAYALLAVAEREDRRSVALLDELHAPVLIANLSSALPIVSGACAVALAGIGFRSEDRGSTAWLDLDVPHELVRVLVGETFHRDFSALEGPARRRLTLLSGEDFGADGPAWQRWWTAAVRTFRARRAILVHQPGDAAGLIVHLREPGAVDPWVLAGPEAAHAPSALDGTLLLSEAQALALVEDFDDIGIFGAECPPGVFGHGAKVGRLEVRLGGQGKVFILGERDHPDWVGAAFARAHAVADENRWQRFFDSARYPSRRAFVDAEGTWWAEPRSESERERRTVELALSALVGASALERGPMVAELAMLASRDGLLVPADLDGFLDALAVEPFWSERALTLVRLALDAVGAAPGGEPGAKPIDAAPGRRLIDTLLRAFGSASRPGLEAVVATAPPALLRTLGVDERPLLREIAAPHIARGGTPEDLDVLRQLLADPNDPIEAAAVAAVGENNLVELRVDVLARSRYADPAVRGPALIALAKLGGEGVLELLVASAGAFRGAIDGDIAEALGELGDERAVPVLVAMLHAGPASPAYEQTRRALRRIGSPAWSELMRLAHGVRGGTRRSAALLLAEQSVPPVVPILIDFLAEDPTDPLVHRELAALTCVDFGQTADAPTAWWDWWDRVPKDDSRAWMRAAQEQQMLPVAPVDGLRGGGTREGALSLVATIERGKGPLVLRAARELGRLLDEDLESPPSMGMQRAAWFADLRERVELRYQAN